MLLNHGLVSGHPHSANGASFSPPRHSMCTSALCSDRSQAPPAFNDHHVRPNIVQISEDGLPHVPSFLERHTAVRHSHLHVRDDKMIPCIQAFLIWEQTSWTRVAQVLRARNSPGTELVLWKEHALRQQPSGMLVLLVKSCRSHSKASTREP